MLHTVIFGLSSAHAPTEWVVGPGRGEGGMKRQLERFVRARFSFQMPLQSTFFFGQLPSGWVELFYFTAIQR